MKSHFTNPYCVQSVVLHIKPRIRKMMNNLLHHISLQTTFKSSKVCHNEFYLLSEKKIKKYRTGTIFFFIHIQISTKTKLHSVHHYVMKL